jgi:hypothetical protein
VKRPRRLAVLAVLCGTVALTGWVGAELAGFGSLGIESTGAPMEVGAATSATARAEHVDAPRATTPGKHGVSAAEIASGALPCPTLLRCRSQPRRPCCLRLRVRLILCTTPPGRP